MIDSVRPSRAARFGRLGRFLASGLAVQGVYALAMALLLVALDLPRQLALALAYVLALAVHFALNRQFVFVRDEGYRRSLSDQGVRYLLVAAVVYVITAASLAVLPGLLGIHPFLAWLIVTGTIGVANFLLLGRVVFR